MTFQQQQQQQQQRLQQQQQQFKRQLLLLSSSPSRMILLSLLLLTVPIKSITGFVPTTTTILENPRSCLLRRLVGTPLQQQQQQQPSRQQQQQYQYKQPKQSIVSSSYSSYSSSQLFMTAVDPTVINNKEYQDICGIEFDDGTLKERLQATKYLYPKHVKVIQDMEPIAQLMVNDVLLETGEKSWQPQDFLPDLTKNDDDWIDQVQELRNMAKNIPDELWVVLIGDMITEEALPTYQTLLNTFEGCDDPTGTSTSAWAQWSRRWTSEENRHGDLLHQYMYLSGQCDMRNVQITIQHLISNGFNPIANKDPYRGFIYTSFQERATKISHGRVGQFAGRLYGDVNLQKICAIIAGDEGRHEKAYQRFCYEILQRDPNGFLIELSDVLRGQIVMPAQGMTNGYNQNHQQGNLYQDFAKIAQRLGVYTALDYADIVQHLIHRWDLEHLDLDLSSHAEQERDYICRLPQRYRKLAERSMNKQERENKNGRREEDKTAFGWIFGRKV